MNRFEAERRAVERMKDNYPPGTRIMLLRMDDPYASIPSGTKGTVAGPYGKCSSGESGF